MLKYKYNILTPDGNDFESDDVFDTEEEAIEDALYSISCCKEGAEILHMSNPGDYDYDEDDDYDYEIIEIDDDEEDY